MAKQPFPLDQGWAWAIVVGCFVCVFFMVGTAKSTGMFLTEFQDYFQVSTSLASMVMGGSAIVYALLAPVCILLGQMFTERRVIMIGSLIGFSGMALGSLLYSMEYVIATFGICFGIGNASIYGNCLVLLGYYFHKRRTLANGMALAGASIGQFAMPPFIEFLLETYGLPGCILLVAGVYIHVLAASSLFRPRSFWDDLPATEAASPLQDAEEDDKEDLKGNGHVSSPLISNGTAPSGHTLESSGASAVDPQAECDVNAGEDSSAKHADYPVPLDGYSSSACSPLVGSAEEKASESVDAEIGSAHKTVHCRSFMTSTGSLHTRPVSLYGSSILMEAHDLQIDTWQEVKSGKEEEKDKGFWDKLKAMFDFSVMQSYIAVFIIITNFLSFFGYFNFVLFLPATVISRGVDKYDKAILVSLCGIGDLTGRLLTAAIGDRNFITRYKLQALGIVAVSINIGMLIVADSFSWMAVHCLLYGIFGGVNVGLAAVVIIDFVGLKNLPRLLAVVMLIQGIGASIGQPFLGGVRDVTGSFQWVMAICAMSCLLGGLVLFSYPLVVKLELRRPERFRLLPD